jgi:predicted AAA+ superfamily ATPase
MIIDDPRSYWIWVIPPHPRPLKKDEEYWQHHGKWLIFSREKRYLDELAKKLDPYVEQGKIDAVKYNREPSEVGRGAMVMCVYCDDRVREEVWKILSSLGVKQKIWKYERQTRNDWKPGGRLYEKIKGNI